jgi:hypothetical protein
MADPDDKFMRLRLEQIQKELEAHINLDKPQDDETMAGPTREEIDAKLAVVEARTETRFVELTGKLDRVADSIATLAHSVSNVRSEVKHESNLTRWTIVGLVIAALAALWVTQSNMLASFTAGIAAHDAANSGASNTRK